MRYPLYYERLTMSDRTEFLEVVAKLSDDARSSAEFLDPLITSPDLPLPIRLEMLKVQTTLNLQDHLLRRMGEHQMTLEDQIEDLVKRVEQQQ